MRLSFLVATALLLTFSAIPNLSAQDDRSSEHLEGLRENRPAQYALVGCTAVISPGVTVEEATILVRDGKIESVQNKDLPIPAAYQRLEMTGKTVYPGLIDAYSEIEVNAEQMDSPAPYWNSNIRPEVLAARSLSNDDSLNGALRKVGVTARLAVPAGGIIQGQSALVLTAGDNVQDALLHEKVAQHATLTLRRRFSSGNRPAYPNSPMGAVALARQAMYDAQWYQQANQAVTANPTLPRPETNDSLAALEPVITGQQPIILDSLNELYSLRAHRYANEFNLRAIIKGSGLEFRRLEEIVATGRPIILPLDFPDAPNVSSFESALEVSLETLMEWDHAPENPARLASAGVPIAFCSAGLDSQDDFLKNIRQAVARGLSKEAALKALTVTPAELFQVDDLIGKIERGKLANLVVTDGDLFDDKGRIVETWVQGVRFQHVTPPSIELTGSWKVETQAARGKAETWKVDLKSSPRSTTGTIEIFSEPKDKPEAAAKPEQTKKSDLPKQKKKKNKNKKRKSRGEKSDAKAEPDSDSPAATEKSATPVKFTKAGFQDSRFSAVFNAQSLGGTGMTRMTFVFSDSQDSAEGFVTLADGTRIPATMTRWSKKSEQSASSDSAAADEKTDANVDQPDERSVADSDQKPESGKTKAPAQASFPVNFPLGTFGRSSLPETETVLIQNVTIWTCAEQGIIPNGSVLLQDGKIAAVGTGLQVEPSDDLVVIDGKGMHLTPGIIDCHSHMATDGGVNESGQAITAEVRVGDFINCDDVNIYRQLAGGVTTSNILHGSANPIGGQNQVIKLRWGMIDEDVKFAEAPQGIKFALGENVKRDRSPSRYPGSRMGVEQIFLDEFRAAQGYEKAWERWNNEKSGLPPRRNLELDAMVEVLNQQRWIHCHSYRQDEILALIRLLDGFDIQIGTFQHILEGYKVADAMKKHGAMGSAFADWWAYKFEVYDAIPYAGALMHNAGVVVSFNSDDRELARHLNHEAAKAVKYGGVPPQEALKFVTLNPAKQLRIDQYVGSIEPGKHADVVLWSGDPLSTLSRCEKTWVDGRRFFDRELDLKQRTEYANMKQTLIQKVLATGQPMNSLPGGRPTKPAEMWPNYDEFCRCKGANR